MKYITFETETYFITVNIERVQSFDTESLVDYAATQLGVDYVDYYEKSNIARTDVITINWSGLINQYRQEMITLKRPARKYAVRF